MRLTKMLTKAASAVLLMMVAASFPAALAQEESAKATQADTSETKVKAPSTENKPASKKTPGPVNNDSAFDYESSEEISQDLSVSFPVDI